MVLEALVFPVIENGDSDDDKCLYCLLVEKFDWRGESKMKESTTYIHTQLACLALVFYFSTHEILRNRNHQTKPGQTGGIHNDKFSSAEIVELNIEVVNKIVPANQTSSDFLFCFTRLLTSLFWTEEWSFTLNGKYLLNGKSFYMDAGSTNKKDIHTLYIYSFLL